MDMSDTNPAVTTSKANVRKLEQANVVLTNQLDDLEQYSRRNCLLLHGINEEQRESTTAVIELCKKSLGVTLERNDIDRSHRVGKPQGDKPRPLIVKYVRYEKREVLAAKRKLKGTKNLVTENLTKRRSAVLTEARSTAGVQAAWTSDGRIVCLLASGRKTHITTKRELQLHGR